MIRFFYLRIIPAALLLLSARLFIIPAAVFIIPAVGSRSLLLPFLVPGHLVEGIDGEGESGS